MTPSPDPMNSWRTALLFGGNSYVALTKPLPAMPAGVTIEFWAFGADDLPRAASLFASGKDHDSRVLNIHLPWSDSCIYWDAGSEGKEFDRIQKTAEPGEYKGSWTHWAFVKDAAKGEMTIYRGNALWHREAGKSRPITDSPQANIGAFVGGSLQWSGRLAEFRIWDKARTAEEIGADSSRRLTGKEPGLVGYWPLSQIDANGTTPDLAGNCPGEVRGATVVQDETLAAAVAATATSEPLKSPEPFRTTPMYFDTKIVSVSSGKVLTVPGSTTQNIPLVLDNDTGAPNQVWRWVSIDDTWSKVVSKASGNLLDAPDPLSGDAPVIALDDGSTVVAVIQCDETGSPNQHWARDVISPCVFKLRVRSSQRYLEATNYPSGTNSVFQREASDRQDQQWHLVMVDLGAEPFKIVSRASVKVLEVPNATTDDVPVGQNADTGNPHQQWRLVPVAGGFLKIVSLSSQKVLDAKGSPTNDSQVIQSADTGEPSQQWRVLYAGSGYYKIVSRTTGKALDVPGSTSDNVPICQGADLGVPNQQWSIVPVPAPKGPLTAAGAGQRPLVLTPEAPEHVVSWAEMTSGIEDYARWQQMFEGRLGKDGPPFRRGRIWA